MTEKHVRIIGLRAEIWTRETPPEYEAGIVTIATFITEPEWSP
jgi:hypothetical protein